MAQSGLWLYILTQRFRICILLMWLPCTFLRGHHYIWHTIVHHDYQSHQILSLQFLRSGEEPYIVHDIMFIKNKHSLISGPPTNMHDFDCLQLCYTSSQNWMIGIAWDWAIDCKQSEQGRDQSWKLRRMFRNCGTLLDMCWIYHTSRQENHLWVYMYILHSDSKLNLSSV